MIDRPVVRLGPFIKCDEHLFCQMVFVIVIFTLQKRLFTLTLYVLCLFFQRVRCDKCFVPEKSVLRTLSCISCNNIKFSLCNPYVYHITKPQTCVIKPQCYRRFNHLERILGIKILYGSIRGSFFSKVQGPSMVHFIF